MLNKPDNFTFMIEDPSSIHNIKVVGWGNTYAKAEKKILPSKDVKASTKVHTSSSSASVKIKSNKICQTKVSTNAVGNCDDSNTNSNSAEDPGDVLVRNLKCKNPRIVSKFILVFARGYSSGSAVPNILIVSTLTSTSCP